ncbi:MAG TPA: DUF3575 domain-containing protein [Flavobacterium sp.]|jgi:hypothetical protein
MKKIIFLLLLCGPVAFSQDAQDSTATSLDEIYTRKNEFRVDVLSLIGQSKLNLSYERFLGRDFSAGLTLGYSSSEKIDDDFDRGYRNTRPEYDITPYVRYKMSKSPHNFYFAEVFISANGGDFKEIVRRTDTEGNGYYVTEKSRYSDFGIGAGLGYKMYLKQQFPIEFMVGFGTNLFDKDKSPDTLSRVGLSVGYRF